MLWSLGNSVWSLLLLAKTGAVAADFGDPPTTSRWPQQAGLGDSPRRWQCNSCPPPCSRGKKGELDPSNELSATQQVQQREALGWSKGGFSTKIHLRCEGNGLPITFLLTVGEHHEAVVFEQLMKQGVVKRAAAGRPCLRPRRVVGDKGYSNGAIRRHLRRDTLGPSYSRQSDGRGIAY